MSKETLVFVGTYTEPIRFGTGQILEGNGEGIYVYRLDASSGALTLGLVNKGITNPSYLAFAPDRRFLYAVNELKTYEGRPTGTVSAFAVDGATGRLDFLNKQLTHGTDPCHVVLDHKGTHAFVANFMSGSVSVLPVRRDGGLDPASDFVQHVGSGVDPNRQQGPHAHSVTLDPADRYAFVPDLGFDKLMIYRFDRRRGLIEPNRVAWIKMKPGAGPRHVALHPTGRFAYLVNELDSTIAALAYDRRTGTFRYIDCVPTLPADFSGASTCADIQMSPSGRFVYASNRGHDSIVVYRVEARSGRLTFVEHQATGGKTPRSFGIDPTGTFLIAANQDSDTVVTYRIDARSGRLQPTGHVIQVPTPVCVKFMTVGGPKSKRA
jgi:6-phosphogluconolactonase